MTFKKFFIDFYRERRGRKRERENHPFESVTSISCLLQFGDRAVYTCPEWESNWPSFNAHDGDNTQPNEPHWPGL